jgi:PAS domain S-box-containing protein
MKSRHTARPRRSPRAAAPTLTNAGVPDDLRLLHELQIHKVELESQNTELIRLRSELEASLARYTDLYEQAPLAYLTLDADGRIAQINRTGAALLARTRHQCIGQQFHRFLGEIAQELLWKMLDEARAGGEERQSEELELQRHDGRGPIRVRLELAHDAVSDTRRVMMIDITERRLLEQALLNAGHREQLRLGADLHDGLGQELTGLSLRLAAMVRSAELGLQPRTAELASCHDAVLQSLAACRALARGLSPLAVYQGGIRQALQDLAEHSRHPSGPEVELEITETADNTLPMGHCDHIYRIVQEGVSNARRHSGAKRIGIAYRVDPRRITLTIADDGCGMAAGTDPHAHEHSAFDAAAADAESGSGLGLRLMWHRAKLIGARMSVVSAPGRGTRIRCVCNQMTV